MTEVRNASGERADVAEVVAVTFSDDDVADFHGASYRFFHGQELTPGNPSG
jgi:hypothetical protein